MAATQRLPADAVERSCTSPTATRSTGCTAPSGSSRSRSRCTRARRSLRRTTASIRRTSSSARETKRNRDAVPLPHGAGRLPVPRDRAGGCLLRAVLRRSRDRPRLEGRIPTARTRPPKGAWARGDPAGRCVPARDGVDRRGRLRDGAGRGPRRGRRAHHRPLAGLPSARRAARPSTSATGSAWGADATSVDRFMVRLVSGVGQRPRDGAGRSRRRHRPRAELAAAQLRDSRRAVGPGRGHRAAGRGPAVPTRPWKRASTRCASRTPRASPLRDFLVAPHGTR